MMTNLFNIFDPSTSTMFSLNWLALGALGGLITATYWLTPSRYVMMMSNMNKFIITEFKLILNKTPEVILILFSIFIFILINNIMGLMPFTFTSTAHMSITLAMAGPLWVGLMMYGWLFNTSNLLVHLIPNGTPAILMPFMVIIETISNLIRPLTLSVRLAANMVAGHLLISLLTSATPLTPMMGLPVLLSAQAALESLEVAVALIQAYVFSVLITLYTEESMS